MLLQKCEIMHNTVYDVEYVRPKFLSRCGGLARLRRTRPIFVSFRFYSFLFVSSEFSLVKPGKLENWKIYGFSFCTTAEWQL
jgi:hypothetical protein